RAATRGQNGDGRCPDSARPGRAAVPGRPGPAVCPGRRPGGRRVRPGAAGPARPGGRADPAAQERDHHVLLRTARGTAGDRVRPGALHRGRFPAPPGNLRNTAMKAPDGLTTQEDVPGELSLECGAVIIGSGAGGATVAAELAGAGVDVIVLEEGGYHPTES